MSPQEVLEYYRTMYNFSKKTKMSHASLKNWLTWGYVPEGSQYKINRLSRGELKVEIKDENDPK